MNEAYKSLAIKIVLMVLTTIAGQLHLKYGATDMVAIATDAVDLGFLIYSLWRVNGMKLVPHDSLAVKQVSGEPISIDALNSQNSPIVKVVGALLLAILLSQFVPVDRANAATANPLSVLQKFTTDDLQAALLDAQANKDIAAVNCYTALIPLVQSGVANPLPKGLGAFQALQKARDLKAMLANLQSPNGPLASLNIACAPLVMDVQTTLIQLGVSGAAMLK